MKIMKNTIQIASFVAIMLTIQGYSCVRNSHSGSDEKEIRKVVDFDGISVSSGIDVFLSMGSHEYVEVEADEDLLDHLVTEVRNGTLKIYFDKSFFWNKSAKVHVEGKKINRISASGGSDIKGKNVIESRDLELKASGGSDIKLEVKTKNLVVEVSGGADIILSGFTDQLQASSSGGSDLKALDLIAKRAQLEASGGADIKVHVVDEIDAVASGGADIAYRGNPEVINSKASSGADINPGD